MTIASTIPLKYLFTATYADGSSIVQTPDDKSLIDPEKRSQFYDVLQMAEKKQLTAFVLKGDGREFGVDLTDGHFEIDGVIVHIEGQDGQNVTTPGASAGKFELIFWRQHTHDFLQKIRGNGEPVETKHEVVYRVGWKLKGNQTYQRVMQVD